MLIIILIFQNSVLYILDIFSTTNLLFKITSLLPSLSLSSNPQVPPHFEYNFTPEREIKESRQPISSFFKAFRSEKGAFALIRSLPAN